jgi:LPXTG-motif cell wall-anchored protein
VSRAGLLRFRHGSSALGMKRFLMTIFVPACLLLFAGVVPVQARISYGSGYYTNLCGGGTDANTYSCSASCDPTKGSCQGSGDVVVKWTCSGQWNQCGDNETVWSSQQSLSGTACDKTVQISVFDKKCRKSDGGWDGTCVLQGYMVWYSGSCGGQQLSPTVAYSATPSATVMPTAKVTTPTPRLTVTPTVRISPTATASATATSSATATLPETGPSKTGVLLILGLVGIGGWYLRKQAAKVI